MSGEQISENEAISRLYAWKQFWRHGADAPEYTEPRKVRTALGMVWHSHPRMNAGVEQRFWPECRCEVEDGVPPLPIVMNVIEGPNGFIGRRKPDGVDVSRLKCHDCGGPVAVQWFHEGKLCGYSCDDEECWPVGFTR